MMNLHKDSTKINQFLQEHLKIRDSKILPCLPQNLEELAATEGAFRRKRGIRSVQDLLKMLFLYTVPDLSFRILAAAACALGIASISKTAWRKRFSGAVPFLRAVPDRMLSGLLTAVNTPEGIKNVYLVDASTIRHQGKEQKQQRIHLFYNPA